MKCYLRNLLSRTRCHFCAVFVLILIPFSISNLAPPAIAQQSADTDKGTLVTTAIWHSKDKQAVVRAPLHEFLTNKQRSMINSGFPTYSSLVVAILNPGETSIKESDIVRRAVFQVDCSVTFDTWEERYDVERLTGQHGPIEVSGFNDYADECLSGVIGDSANTDRLVPGGLMVATLVVKQTSPEETAKIKAWLGRQQSGLMQGLFSHMLGELALNATANIVVRVPPSPKVTLPSTAINPAKPQQSLPEKPPSKSPVKGNPSAVKKSGG